MKEETHAKQIAIVYADGRRSAAADHRKLTGLKAQYFYGSTDYTANSKAQFLWEKYESGSWVTVQAEATGNNGNTYTVHAADVVGSATYRCRARYNSGSVHYYDTITIIDKTDNYQADIDSTAGDVFKNTVGQTCLICRLWQNGAEVDPLKSTTYSKTAPSSPSAGDFYYQIQNSGAATKLMRYSGSAWADVTSDATYGHEKTYTWYRRDKDGNPMDSGAAFATGNESHIMALIIKDHRIRSMTGCVDYPQGTSRITLQLENIPVPEVHCAMHGHIAMAIAR